MAKEKARSPQQTQRLPGAEDACISQEQLEIVEWYRKVKFRKNLLGGVDEVQMWKKLEELYGLYENAIRAERARYNALLALSVPSGDSGPLSGCAIFPRPGEVSPKGGAKNSTSEPLASPPGRGGSTAGADGEGEPSKEGC